MCVLGMPRRWRVHRVEWQVCSGTPCRVLRPPANCSSRLTPTVPVVLSSWLNLALMPAQYRQLAPVCLSESRRLIAAPWRLSCRRRAWRHRRQMTSHRARFWTALTKRRLRLTRNCDAASTRLVPEPPLQVLSMHILFRSALFITLTCDPHINQCAVQSLGSALPYFETGHCCTATFYCNLNADPRAPTPTHANVHSCSPVS